MILQGACQPNLYFLYLVEQILAPSYLYWKELPKLNFYLIYISLLDSEDEFDSDFDSDENEDESETDAAKDTDTGDVPADEVSYLASSLHSPPPDSLSLSLSLSF